MPKWAYCHIKCYLSSVRARIFITLAEFPKHPVFGIPMKMDLKRLQMSWCHISSPRKLLRSTFLGWILNFRSGDMGLAVSTGLEVTRQGAITWGKKAVERQDHWGKKRGKKSMKYYKTIITCCIKSTGQRKQPCL